MIGQLYGSCYAKIFLDTILYCTMIVIMLSKFSKLCFVAMHWKYVTDKDYPELFHVKIQISLIFSNQ